jgi:hypothetical protein
MEKTHCDICARFTTGTGFVRFEHWVTTLIKAKSELKSFLWDLVYCFGGVMCVEADSAGNPKDSNQGLHLKYACIVNLMQRAGFNASEKTLKRHLDALVELGILSKGVPAQHSAFARIYFLNTSYAHQWDYFAKEKAAAQLAQSKYKNQVRVQQEYQVDQTDEESIICNAVAEAAVKLLPKAKAKLVKNCVYQYLIEAGNVQTAMIAVFDLKHKADSIPFTHAAFLQGLKSHTNTIPAEYVQDVADMHRKLNNIRLTGRN